MTEHRASKDRELDVLLAGCRQDQRGAQEKLYRRYLPLILGICLRYADDRQDAAALSNMAFLKIFRSLDQLRDNQAFIAWAGRIAVHTGLDHLRRKASAGQWHALDGAPEPVADAEILDRIDTEALLHHVRELPPMSRAVFLLAVVEGFSHAEIAERLSISEGTSRWHLSAARSEMKRLILANHKP